MQGLLEELRTQHDRHFGWSLACCGWQPDLAEDVLQEAYLRVLDGRATFEGRALVTTWFYSVVRYVALEMQRSSGRDSALNLRLVDENAAQLPVSPEPGELERDEEVQALRAAMLLLSQRQREVLHLVFYAELTLEQVGAVLDMSVGSVRTHYHRGKLRLAELLHLENGNDEIS